MQWAIGDWYNSIPWGDKEAACNAVGLNYDTAKRYAVTCLAFPKGDRDQHLGFKLHQYLEIQELTDNQRRELLEKASKDGWSVARLRLERDQVLGAGPQQSIAALGVIASAVWR